MDGKENRDGDIGDIGVKIEVEEVEDERPDDVVCNNNFEVK